MVPDAVDLQSARRALVVKLRHHGDVLLASPVFSVLKAHAPHLEIDALVYDDTVSMLAMHPAIAMIHTVGRDWRARSLPARMAEEWRLLRALRARSYDLLVHLTDHPRGAWLARLLGVDASVAPARTSRARWWRRSFTHRYPVVGGGRRHTVELNLDALRRIGVQPGRDDRRLVLIPGREAEAKAERILQQHGLSAGKFIQFHPASRWQFKCWPVEQCAALIDALAGDGMQVVVTGAPSDVERRFVTDIQSRAKAKAVDLTGTLTLKELAAISERARLFIGVDSAPMHIAAAMRIPCVALFGPSGDLEWGPWQVAHRIVASDAHPCRPCGNDGCGGGKVSECLTTLTVRPVLAAVHELLTGHA